MISNDARCTREIKSRIAMANAAFSKKKILFKSKLEESSEVSHLEHSYMYGDETWTVRKVDQQHLESLK